MNQALPRQAILDAFLSGPPVKKPWVLLGTKRKHLEQTLGLSGPKLLRQLVPFFEENPHMRQVIIGQGRISGNLYLGTAIGKEGFITPLEALVANLFAHGELGVELICMPGVSRGIPEYDFSMGRENEDEDDETPIDLTWYEKLMQHQVTMRDVALLQKLDNYTELKVDMGIVSDDKIDEHLQKLTARKRAREANFGNAQSKQEAIITDDYRETPKDKMLRKRALEIFHSAEEMFGEATKGNLLNHEGYVDTSEDFTLVGDTADEQLEQYATYMRDQAYGENKTAVSLLVGGEQQGAMVFGGASLGDLLDPIQVACVQMLSNGVSPSLVASACVDAGDDLQMKKALEDDLRQMNPKVKLVGEENKTMNNSSQISAKTTLPTDEVGGVVEPALPPWAPEDQDMAPVK